MSDITLVAKNVNTNVVDGNLVFNYPAGASGDVGDAVSINSDAEAIPADANDGVGYRARGIAVATTSQYGDTSFSEGDRVAVCISGVVDGFTGMTPGADVYVSATAGKITHTPPTPNAYQYRIGYALTATSLMVSPEAEAGYSV